jgi:hypothetical protein
MIELGIARIASQIGHCSWIVISWKPTFGTVLLWGLKRAWRENGGKNPKTYGKRLVDFKVRVSFFSTVCETFSLKWLLSDLRLKMLVKTHVGPHVRY